MIKASCIPCGTDLGSFRNRKEYLEWRRKTETCRSCSAHLDTSLFTSYEKEKPPAEEEEPPAGEENPADFGDILRGRRRK